MGVSSQGQSLKLILPRDSRIPPSSAAPLPMVIWSIWRIGVTSTAAAAINAARVTILATAVRWGSYRGTIGLQPAVASLLTSRMPSDAGVQRLGDELPAAATTAAELLGSRGYATAAVVSHYLLAPLYGFDQGFEHFDGKLETKGTSLSNRRLRDAGSVTEACIDGSAVSKVIIETASGNVTIREKPGKQEPAKSRRDRDRKNR